jgi:serine/threonine protein kinase
MTTAISPGTKFGRYEIRSQIGAGGMGEVYRARDEKLNRDVAVKVLPPAFSEHPDRLHRFEQEAQATGTLNHPNILAVYDVGTHDGAPYVVSELLEGETLRERINEGRLPSRKAIDYAVQIARGLAAAHEKGIIHRDIKPDNIFLTNDDRVKILDFGLAKLVQSSPDDVAQTDIATRKVHTDPGTVMGTTGYMSPEQVRGRATDHRSDIFSFGAVLYEMVSGRRAFHGESAIETLNAILKGEPPELTSSDAHAPPALERVVWHCLEKSPERRFQSASDVAFALEALSGVTSHPSQQSVISGVPNIGGRRMTRERLVWMAACLLLFVVAAGFAFAYFSRSQPTETVIRLALPVPANATNPAHISVSPDGRSVAFLANTSEGKQFLWIRTLDSLSAKMLEGTEGAIAPFWSPDSRYIGYFANRKLLKMAADGGRPQVLCDVTETRGGAWSSNGTILFAGSEGLYRVPAQGGKPVLATKLSEREEAHRWPYFLPDGRHFIFLADAATTEDHHIRVGTLDSQETTILLSAISRIAYAQPGYLLYVNQGALVAQPFDASTLKTTGDPLTITEHVAEVGQNHEFDFSVSDSGVLAYQSGNPTSQLTWFDRTGKKLETIGEPGNYASITLAPEGKHAALALLDADGRVADIWQMDLLRGSSTRLTFDPAADSSPVWSPDGTKIAFSSNRAGNGQVNLFLKTLNAAGDEQMLFQADSEKFASSWSPDGQYIAFENWAPKSKGAIWILPLASGSEPKPLLQSSAFNYLQPQFSRDGYFVAYTSDESGRPEIYVQPFPTSGEKSQISLNGGIYPIWRHDGKELFYVTPDGKLMSADIQVSPKFQSSVPRQLFQTNIKITDDGWSVAPAADGQRFLLNVYAEGNTAPLSIVLNWTAELKQRK